MNSTFHLSAVFRQPADAFLYKAMSDFECFFFYSPPHLKSEPEDDFYHSPKHEKSLKRERDDDNE